MEELMGDRRAPLARRVAAVLVAMAAGVSAGCVHRPAAPAGGNTMVLSCRSSAGQQAADPQAKRVNGVESFALRGDTNAYDTLPAWRVAGRRYLIWKTFLAVAASARPYRVVTVSSPSTARLFYAGPGRWGAVSGRDRIGAAARQIRLPACGGRFTGYTGGILVTHPACVRLAVSAPDRRAVTVSVPILVSHC
jgi:hypothetical protein